MRQLATAITLVAISAVPAIAQGVPNTPFADGPSSVQNTGPFDISGGNVCGAAAHIYIVGLPLNEALKYGFFDDALIRRPGEAFATVFIPDQLNLEVDEEDIIQRVFCG